MQAQAGGAVVAAVGDEVSDGLEVGVEQGGDVLALFGDEAVELSAGVLEQGDRVIADALVALQLRGERGSSGRQPRPRPGL